MKSSPEIPAVYHDTTARRFEIVLDGHRSELDYEEDGDSVAMTHTFVPPELRGRGLAEKLTRAALDWARGDKKRVVPACSYVAVFIQRHPEYRDLVSE